MTAAPATDPPVDDAALRALGHALAQATGADPDLDRAVARVLAPDAAAADYTASVEGCTALLRRVLPGWSWHVGWGATGLFPYACLRCRGERVCAEAPTVPLALLRALVRAVAGERDPPPAAPPRPPWRR